jgi:hypothetical protein
MLAGTPQSGPAAPVRKQARSVMVSCALAAAGLGPAALLEPPVGIEPTTYSLREARTAALEPPPTPMASPGARNARYAPITAG